MTSPAEVSAAALALPVPARRVPRRLRFGRWIALIVALLAAGELGARLWEAGGEGTATLYDTVVLAGSRFKMKPRVTVHVPERYGTITYTFNADGYRDGEHANGSRRQRLVLLGDSVTFGLGAPQEQIYPAVLQRQLDERLGPRYDVVNLAIFAYNTADELAALREDGRKHQPRLVVVQFFMNDLSQPAADAPPRPPTSWQRLLAVKNRYLYRSALARRLHQGFTRAAYVLVHDVRRSRFPDTLNDAEPRSKIAYLREHGDDSTVPAFASLLAIRDAAASLQAPLLILVTPDETQLFSSGFDAIDARLAAFCAKHRIPFVDALPHLRAAPDRQALYLDGVHLSPQGHALVGRLLASELVARGLVGH